jgi:hypothetical protein
VLLSIEAESGLPRSGVRPVTGEAGLSEDRTDVPVEPDGLGRGATGAREEQDGEWKVDAEWLHGRLAVFAPESSTIVLAQRGA